MLLVSLMVGVVLAVLSVPVSAVVLVYGPQGSAPTSFGFDVVERQPILVHADRYTTATVWRVEAVPFDYRDNPADVELTFGPGFSPNVGALPEMSGMALLPNGSMWVMRTGWPMHAATAFEILGPPQASTGVVGGLAMTLGSDYIVVPYMPLATGAIANTLFYAALTFVLLATVRLLRTRRRSRRGQCLACGYELDDDMAVCPECGLAANAS